MFNFNNFLMESKFENLIPICYSNRLLDILINLQKKGSVIAKEFLKIENQNFDVSFIDVTDKDDMVSYITSNKAKQILDKYKLINRQQEGLNLCWIDNRQEQKITRFLNRIFKDKFKQKEIEDFIDEYKSELKGDKSFDKFEIVEGEDVRKFYYGRNYSQDSNGQLQRSCMKYDQCGSYFDIYVQNSKKMKMLILKQKDGIIYGRANLWYLDDPKDKIFMDRIYTTYDWQIKLFIDYAIKNNYIYKSKQIYGGSVIPIIDNGGKEKIIMSVNLTPNKYKYYPYVDTLQFYNQKDGTLTSDIKKFHDKDYISLVMANGDYLREGQEGFVIDNLGRIVNRQLVYWSDIDNVNIHRDNAVPLHYRGRNVFVTQDHDFINIGGEIFLKDDMDYDEDKKAWTIKKNI